MNISLPFGKKKKGGGAAGSASYSRPPAISRINELYSYGISEPEIIKTLRTEGYSPMEVDSAMKQILRSAAYGPESSSSRDYQQQEYGQESAAPAGPQRKRIFPEEEAQSRGATESDLEREDMLPEDELPEIPMLGGLGEPLPGSQSEEGWGPPRIGERPMPRERPRVDTRSEMRHELEEISEAIIEEKAELFRKEVDGISDEIKRAETKMEMLEQRFEKLESSKRSEIEEVRSMINQYKESMADVSARMVSVERAMKDSLTPMMQTLRSLSDAIREIKRK